jgi:hypothetical protein
VQKPCSSSQRWVFHGRRKRSPRKRHQQNKAAEASAKRYTTEMAGGTLPSCQVMAQKVEPQIRDAMANKRGEDIWQVYAAWALYALQKREFLAFLRTDTRSALLGEHKKQSIAAKAL